MTLYCPCLLAISVSRGRSLRKHLTGEPCDHENDVCCQGELKEAIHKLEANNFNLPAFLWRGILNG